MTCADANKITFVALMLVEEVENWWRFTKQQLKDEGRQITWEVFKHNFLEKYFQKDLRRMKGVEFINIRQRTMFVGK